MLSVGFCVVLVKPPLVDKSSLECVERMDVFEVASVVGCESARTVVVPLVIDDQHARSRMI